MQNLLDEALLNYFSSISRDRTKDDFYLQAIQNLKSFGVGNQQQEKNPK
jgi:hypothetical protein